MATETVYPPTDIGKRYKTKFPTAGVIEKFIENRQWIADSQNLHMDRGRLFSYGWHYPLARWVRNTTGGPVFMLVRSVASGASMTTLTKHRSPLIQAIAQNTHFYAFIVETVDKDGDDAHVHNCSVRYAYAEQLAKKVRGGPVIARWGKAWSAIDYLFVTFMYANRCLTGGFPSSEMPHGILRDWLEEKMPSYPFLIQAAHTLATTQRPEQHS